MAHQQHPIQLPHDLVHEWEDKYHGHMPEWVLRHVATEAAQWGADQELEACCEWLDENSPGYDACEGRLDAARRPKPPSLKEQSIALLDLIQGNKKPWQLEDLDVVRRALEQLTDCE
jgi:hypothetical protein